LGEKTVMLGVSNELIEILQPYVINKEPDTKVKITTFGVKAYILKFNNILKIMMWLKICC